MIKAEAATLFEALRVESNAIYYIWTEMKWLNTAVKLVKSYYGCGSFPARAPSHFAALQTDSGSCNATNFNVRSMLPNK